MLQTKYQRLKDYINSLKKGTVFSREEMFIRFSDCCKSRDRVYTIDTYRRNFEKLGYLIKVGRGKYKKLKQIHEELTCHKCSTLANDRSWKSWFIDIEDRIKLKKK